ncbi:hypothetical protein A3L04_03610 [Thermococcus chitonophagus]|uniref:Uncharacterized protein n=1 Tax=Thermococcus chitonophagus TaxID=54262 RepID=A0A2Z2N308_9EURY|nr:hypothetical protein A3L04_03610 [Thermococcus chitonophagus]
MISSFFRFLFKLVRISFGVAGIVRIVNRGERAFKKALIKEGLPQEVVEELMEEFSLRKAFNFQMFFR